MPRPAVVTHHPLRRLVTAGVVGSTVVWVSRLLAVKRSVGRYASHWAGSGTAPAGSFALVALGDSSAQAIGASSPERGWVGLLAEHLRGVHGRPVHVVNLSRSGAVVADVLADQVPRLGEHRQDLVVVGIGGNDVIGRWDAGTFAAQVDGLVAALPRQTVVADVPYFMHGEWQRRAAAAAEIVRTAAARRGFRVARVHDAMRSHGWWAMASHYSADFFHPNDRGYAVWAQAFVTALDSGRR